MILVLEGGTPMSVLKGKGLWAYRSKELDRTLEIAPEIGATHVLYKVGQGGTYYDDMAEIAGSIEEAGLVPLAWMWVLLDDPKAEAQVVVRAFDDGFKGFVFDTEAGRCRNRFEQAERLGQYLGVAGLEFDRLYNCSYMTISQHPELPYEQMNEFCRGGFMPMSYGTFFAPESTVPHDEQARRVIDEWTYGHFDYWSRRWGYRLPLYPVLAPYHDVFGNVRMGPEEFQKWLDRLAAHSPTFFSVFTTAVIDDGLLPILRDFELSEENVGETESRTYVRSLQGRLNIRLDPSTEHPPIARVDEGEALEALEGQDDVREKVGKDGEWIKVRAPDGSDGYVAAWHVVQHREPLEVGLRVQVVSPDLGFLYMVPAPTSLRPPITRVELGEVLDVIEPADSARDKVGQTGQWIYVRTDDGIEGCLAAQYLSIYDEEEQGEPISHLVVFSSAGLNLRKSEGTGDPPVWKLGDRTVLEVQEDTSRVVSKIGKDKWIRVRTPSLREGYVNALYVRPKKAADKRQPVEDVDLPRGECAWLFGIHAAGATSPADFRFLFEGTGKTGWVLFTEAVGVDPNHGGGHDYSPWSGDGHGVIVRLDNAYSSDGTVPVRSKYPEFARACARYVENSKGCFIWVIGNEPNNVREHPGGAKKPVEHVGPEMFAEAFNMVRQAIKEVQPEAIVVPGAVDPYNTYPWKNMSGQRYRPLDYFKELMSCIEDLDGVALHTYTHGMDVSLITRPTLFRDAFLEPGTPREHYYDFQAYRSFAEAIPDKWRDRPIYLTETNHWVAVEHWPRNEDEARLVGWLNKDKGWVRAAYSEINRWNCTPFAQQIQCLLLYRWNGDAWAIDKMDQVHADFRGALSKDYRWRR
jgi:hypothetical protein